MTEKQDCFIHANNVNGPKKTYLNNGYYSVNGTQNNIQYYNLNPIKYTFNESTHLTDLLQYVNSTYTQHYSGKDGEKTQVTKLIMDHATSPDFFTGNIIKYAARYGKKDGYNKKDLYKILHYGIMLLEYHDTKHKDK